MWGKWLAWRCERFEFWGLKCYGCGSQNGWRVNTCARRSCSYVAAATCRDCGSAYFLKKIRTADTAAECAALWEYQVLERLGSEKGTARNFLTPRVYDFCASTCAYSMQLLVGQPLDERLRTSTTRQGFDDCLRLAAAWLRELHHHEVECEPGKSFSQLMQQIDSNCASLAARDRLGRKGLELLRENLAQVDQGSIHLVPLHGDFKASNLIQTSAGVYGIDIGLKYKNAGTMDAAKFIADLILNRKDIKVIRQRHDVADTVNVFMAAYGDNSPGSRKQVAWWLIYLLLFWWKGELDGWKPAPLVDHLYSKAIEDAIAFSEAIFSDMAATQTDCAATSG